MKIPAGLHAGPSRLSRLLLLGLVLGCATSATAAEFFVAPEGNDANPGTKERPFATLGHARDAVRQTNRKGHEPIRVVLREGIYRLSEPLLLSPEDSGTADCPIVYTAAAGEKAVLSGGRVLRGWKRGSGELWTTEIPEVKEGKWYFRQLFVNGERRGRARIPAQGQFPVAGHADPHLRSFKFAPGQLDPQWHNLEDVEIVVLQWWAESRLRIESIDQATNTVRFTGDCFRPADWAGGWFAENVREGLTQPGQWYLDRTTGVLSYWPLPNEKVEELEFVAPVTKQWLRIEGDYKTGTLVEHVTFRGLGFQHSSWEMDPKLGYSYFQNSVEVTPGQRLIPGWVRPQQPEDERLSDPQAQVPVPSAIYVRGGRHIRFEDNEIAHTGAWAIHLAQGGSQDDHIVGNHLHDLGAGAVRVGGPDPTNDEAEESGRAIITDNRIHNCSQVYYGAPAIFAGQSSGNLIAHNEITGWCEWAITLGWSWGYFPLQNARDNLVEYNHIHHFGGSPLTMPNHSALYAMGIQPGTVFRYNLVHDNTSPYSNGIILDAGASAMRVEFNVIYNVQGGAMICNFNNFGHIIQNNVFALSGNMLSRSGDPGPQDQTGAIYRNLFYYNSDQKQGLFHPNPWSNYDVVLDYNLYFDASGKPPKFLDHDFDTWKAQSADHWKRMEKGKGLDANSIVADPMFVDPEHGDFRLKPESPALKLGFRSIDLSTVGVRPRGNATP